MDSTILQLKAAAYDQLVVIENAQKRLNEINQQIAQVNAMPADPQTPEDTAAQDSANPSQ